MSRVLRDGVRSWDGNSGWLHCRAPQLPIQGRAMLVLQAPLMLMFCFEHECGQKAGRYLVSDSYMLIFLIVTGLTGSIQAKIIFRKKENLSRWLRFPQAVWSRSISPASRILSPSTCLCSPLARAQAQMSSPHICITCWHDITLFFKSTLII